MTCKPRSARRGFVARDALARALHQLAAEVTMMMRGSLLVVMVSVGFLGCASAPEEVSKVDEAKLTDTPCYATDDPDACYESREPRAPFPTPTVQCFVGCPAGTIQTETCACIGTPVERPSRWGGED